MDSFRWTNKQRLSKQNYQHTAQFRFIRRLVQWSKFPPPLSNETTGGRNRVDWSSGLAKSPATMSFGLLPDRPFNSHPSERIPESVRIRHLSSPMLCPMDTPTHRKGPAFSSWPSWSRHQDPSKVPGDGVASGVGVWRWRDGSVGQTSGWKLGCFFAIKLGLGRLWLALMYGSHPRPRPPCGGMEGVPRHPLPPSAPLPP